MPLLYPSSISREVLEPGLLKTDFSSLRKFGPLGLGKHALYLNSFFGERRYYIPLSAVERVFKRVAMSRGGFTGKGLFASISYLVVQFDDGKERQSAVRREEDIDMLLAAVAYQAHWIKTLSSSAETRLKEARRQEEMRYLKKLSPRASESVSTLSRQRDFLLAGSEYLKLQHAAKAKRADDISKKSLKWLATAIVICSAVSFIYGLLSLIRGEGSFGIYFTLFGLAAIFLFSGLSVMPTGKNNRKAVRKSLDEAVSDINKRIASYPGFFLPPWYAHPVCLDRMIRIIREGRAETEDESFSLLKSDLKALDSSVQVSREEYEEIAAIKPLFLIRNYE